ncbi:MAG: hypothetical protein KDA85_03805, partial [Planctomycetaceae bacterium]|nr:hypothetical protein [Planctomycetaceae bacterium]
MSRDDSPAIRMLERQRDHNRLVRHPLRILSMSSATVVPLVAIVFLLHSLIHSAVPGAGEPHYFSNSRAFVDPAWCGRDFFLQSGNPHYWFYVLTGPIVARLPFPAVAYGGRAFSLLLLAFGWQRLSRRLGLSPFATVQAAVAYCGIVAWGSFSGEWIVGGLEAKVPAYAFAFCGIADWLDSRVEIRTRSLLKSGGWFGLSAVFHPVVGLWFVIAVGMSEVAALLWRVRSRRAVIPARTQTTTFLRDAAIFLTAFAIPAAAGVFPALHVVNADTVARDQAQYADFIQVFWRLSHHLDPSVFWKWGMAFTLSIATLGIAAAAGIAVVRRRIHEQSQPSLWLLWLLLGMSAVIAGVGFTIGFHAEPAEQLTDWQWRAALLKFYPFRLFDALLPVTASLTVILLLQTLLAPWQPQLSSFRLRSAVVLLAVLTMIGVSWIHRSQAPAFYTPAQYVSWQHACEFIRTKTPDESLIVTPSVSWGFKWYAQRAEYVCFKDCPQEAAGILEWNRRLWLLADWRKTSYRDGVVTDDELSVLR